MTVIVKEKADLVVPSSLRRRAVFKAGDRLEFMVSPRNIVITAAPAERPNKSELSAIRRGETQIARGEFVGLTELLNDLDRHCRKGRAKTTQKTSR